ncbi:MAG: hypothetical protein A3K19_24965 [Lentisphaerae bacterium RIFOXYB12_FULL_65_16]|nr:MAG: hypothetical protein A3K18_24895 [Lentisphaerae bacterium RIFOXYA12_64_32]OGV90722.1 MAG: hypothetical protein A3K19_24965 [Lentisphaerae bacterium RIFOXYB12_FULL_65_16]
MATIFGWACFVLLGLAAGLEPTEPKKDKRTKTGYKGNATVPKKSDGTKKAQKFLVVLGLISGVIWYFLQGD